MRATTATYEQSGAITKIPSCVLLGALSVRGRRVMVDALDDIVLLIPDYFGAMLAAEPYFL